MHDGSAESYSNKFYPPCSKPPAKPHSCMPITIRLSEQVKALMPNCKNPTEVRILTEAYEKLYKIEEQQEHDNQY